MHGECESLAYFLFLFNNNQGNIIELKKKDDISTVFHYVYSINDKFYDFNGEFKDLESLSKKSKLFGDCNDIVLKLMDTSNTWGMENTILYKNILNKLNERKENEIKEIEF